MPGEEVADAGSAGDDDDEHALQASAHVVGGRGLQDRRAEDRAHVVRGARAREQHRRDDDRPDVDAGRPGQEARRVAHRRDEEHHAEAEHARAVDLDRPLDREALPPHRTEPPGEDAAGQRADGERGEQQPDRHRAAAEEHRPDRREQHARLPEGHGDDVDEEGHPHVRRAAAGTASRSRATSGPAGRPCRSAGGPGG